MGARPAANGHQHLVGVQAQLPALAIAGQQTAVGVASTLCPKCRAMPSFFNDSATGAVSSLS